MADCVRTPTRTTNVPSVTYTVITTTRTIESVLPGRPITSPPLPNVCTASTCNGLRARQIGETVTTYVIEITTLPVTAMVPTTLFGTSCPPEVPPSPDPEPAPIPDPPTSTPDPPTSITSSPTPVPDPPTPISNPPTPISDPPSSSPSLPVITGPSSLPRSTRGYTITSPGSSDVPSTSTLPQGTKSRTNVAPIAGGVAGGVVGLLVLGMIAWFFLKKAAFWKFSKSDNNDLGHVHPEKPLMNLSLQGDQQVIQNIGQNSSHPPANNNGANNAQQNQGQPTGYQGQGQESYLPNASVNGYHPPQTQQGYYGPPSTLSHNPSVTSSGYYGSLYGSPQQPVGGLPPAQGHGHTPSLSTSSDGRTGSPVPIQNNQILQVVNPEPSYQYDQGTSSYPAASSATPAYQTDGKGRPVNTGREKAPIVHLDGGRYEESGPSTSGATQPPSGPPPMYHS